MTTLDENGRVDLTWFEVNAADGPVGTVDKATYDIGREFLVVSAGWTRSRAKRVLPAGVVRDVDARRRKVLVSCTRNEFEAAPDYDRVRRAEEDYWESIDAHYGAAAGRSVG